MTTVQTTCPQCGFSGNFPVLAHGHNAQCPRCFVQFRPGATGPRPVSTHGVPAKPKQEYVSARCPQCKLEGDEFLVVAPGRIRCPKCMTQFARRAPDPEPVPIDEQEEKPELEPGKTVAGEDLPDDVG